MSENAKEGVCLTNFGDVFDQTLHEETTVGDVVQALQHFSPTRKRAICVMIADMETASMVHIQRKKERN